MTTIIPQGEELRRAVKWLSEERQTNPDKKIGALVDEACLKFDLSPSESEYLLRLIKNGA